MNCKIIEEIKNSEVKSWININTNQTNIDTSWEVTSSIYEKDEIIPTEQLIEDLESLLEDKDLLQGSYENEEIVMCLKPHEPDHVDWNPDYEVHKKYPVHVKRCAIFRMEKGLDKGGVVGTIKDYNPVQHFGKTTRPDSNPDFLEYLGLDEVVLIEPEMDTEVIIADIRKCIVPRAGFVLNEELSTWVPMEQAGWDGDKNKKMVNWDGIRYIIDDDEEEDADLATIIDNIEKSKEEWISKIRDGEEDDSIQT